jgi:hypothetical protein
VFELLSALVLFGTAVLLAAALAAVGFVIRPGAAMWLTVDLGLVWALIVVLAAAATAWITIAAMGGRRHPLFDGLAVVLVLGLGAAVGLSSLESPDYRAWLTEVVWLGFGRALVALVPAWTIAWFALRRTVALRGIAPERDTTAQKL